MATATAQSTAQSLLNERVKTQKEGRHGNCHCAIDCVAQLIMDLYRPASHGK